MEADRDELASTTSLCPTCLEAVPGRYVATDGAVFLERTCPEHGAASRRIWGSHDHWEWAQEYGPEPPPGGELSVDNSHACLAVVEVTQRCNLSCAYCFASSGPGGRDLAFDEIVHLFEVVVASGRPRPVQLSGGEPTVRDSLESTREIVERRAHARARRQACGGDDGS